MKQKNILIILLLFISSWSLLAQETEDPELEAYRQMQAEYAQTGFEIFIYYPVSFHLPGWSYPDVKYSLGPARIYLPGPNVSLVGLGAGIELDFGSRKPVIRNMGFGGSLEISKLADWNMKPGVHMDLVLSTLFLYYKSDMKRVLNYTIRGWYRRRKGAERGCLVYFPRRKGRYSGSSVFTGSGTDAAPGESISFPGWNGLPVSGHQYERHPYPEPHDQGRLPVLER